MFISSPIAKHLESTSIRYQSDVNVSDHCLMDVDQSILVVSGVQYANCFAVLCFAVVTASFLSIMSPHGNNFCFTGTLEESTCFQWIPSQGPMGFYMLFDVNLKKQLNKHLICWWFEKAWCPCDVTVMVYPCVTSGLHHCYQGNNILWVFQVTIMPDDQGLDSI